MTMLKRCLSYLKQHHIRFSHSTHSTAATASELASAERMPASCVAKTLVYTGDNGYAMLVLQANAVVDFEEVSKLLGLSEVRLLNEAELAILFPDCEVGAMPPLGNLFKMPVLMDQELALKDFMAFNAGTHRDAIHISVADFRKLENPLIASFAATGPLLV